MEPVPPGRPQPLPARWPWHLGVAGAVAGLALSAIGPGVIPWLALALFAALTASRAAALGVLVALLVLGGGLAGAARLDSIDGPADLVRDGKRVRLAAHLLAQPRESPFGSSAEVRVVAGRLRGARLLMRVPRWERFPAGVPIGGELVVEGRLSALARADRPQGNEGGFDFTGYLRRRGVVGQLLAEGVRATARRRGGLAGAVDRMRQRAELALAAGLSPRELGLLRGMVLGADEGIPAATREDFRASGLAHLLAVSGQNVMLLAALALPLLALSGFGLGARLAALALLIAVYVALAGAGPSLQRAGVMGLAGIAAMAFSRPASRWYALLLAAAVTLTLNPRACQDPGWQLSFAAVVGILALGQPLARVLHRAAAEAFPARPGGRQPRLGAARAVALRGLGDGIAISVAATLATGPLLAHHFGSVAPAGLAANLLALPAVAPAMWLGMVLAALGQLSALGPMMWQLAEPAARACGWVAELPVGFIALLAERFADLPGGQLGLRLGSPVGLAGTYAALAGAALGAWRTARRVEPHGLAWLAGLRRLPGSRRVAAAAALFALLLLGGLAALAPPAPPGQLTISFLDVGQGDATLVQHPDGATVLFDAGPPEAGITRLLRRAGADRIDLLVATHASRDHQGGLIEVLRHHPVGTLLDGGDGSSDPDFRAVLAEAQRQGVRVVRAVAPLELQAGGLGIRVLSPPPRPPGPAPEDPNPRAVVALVSAGRFDLLLSADAESDALLPLQLPPVDAMKVPHHGSADPGLRELLERTGPALAAIEVGQGNGYGHPAPSTLAALRGAGVRVYRTDRHGTVRLTVEGSGLRVTTER